MSKFTCPILMLITTILLSPAWAADLVCDPQDGVAFYDLEINGEVIENIPAQQDGSLLYSLDDLPPGPHTFRAVAVSAEGWRSAFSNPFEAIKPTAPDLSISK